MVANLAAKPKVAGTLEKKATSGKTRGRFITRRYATRRRGEINREEHLQKKHDITD